MDKFWSLQICPSSVESTSKVSVYTSETKWTLSKNKKDHQICHSMTRTLLNQNKNKEALKTYTRKSRTKTPKVSLKLPYGSRLPLKSLQKWLENRYRSRVAVEPPKSIEMRTKGKTKHVPYEDIRCRVSNNTIKTHVTSS